MAALSHLVTPTPTPSHTHNQTWLFCLQVSLDSLTPAERRRAMLRQA